jgi:predicted amidohydrolase YtcJ
MPNADLILVNGNIHTLSKKKPKAQAIAIKGNKITAVGTNSEILKLKTPETRITDLKGKTVLPGFVDCHVHMRSYAKTLEQIALRDIISIGQLQQRLKQAAAEKPPNAWIVARGFDQEKLKEKRLPTRFDIDKAVPDHPVLITRVCGHLSVANSKALELANITKHTKLLGSGEIDKDKETGEPTGILLEDAQSLVKGVIPQPTEEELLRVCGQACEKAAEKGLTTVHCIIEDLRDIQIIQKLHRQNQLQTRIRIIIPVECLDEFDELKISKHIEDDKVKIGCFKVFSDGSLGARTAALHTPYADDKTTRGILVYTPTTLQKSLEKVHKRGFQLAIHAIGDKANETVLDALEEVLKGKPRRDHRHRVEHASVLNKKLITRMKKLGVVASVQPHFVVSDFWVVKRLGKRRARWTYPFKSLIKSGVVACAGSDCPIEPLDPLFGVWAAVARKTFPQEKLSVDEAICMYTINAAYASHEETTKGTIEPGKLADLTILAQDPYSVEPDDIRDIKVEMTIVNGKIIYARKS